MDSRFLYSQSGARHCSWYHNITSHWQAKPEQELHSIMIHFIFRFICPWRQCHKSYRRWESKQPVTDTAGLVGVLPFPVSLSQTDYAVPTDRTNDAHFLCQNWTGETCHCAPPFIGVSAGWPVRHGLEICLWKWHYSHASVTNSVMFSATSYDNGSSDQQQMTKWNGKEMDHYVIRLLVGENWPCNVLLHGKKNSLKQNVYENKIATVMLSHISNKKKDTLRRQPMQYKILHYGITWRDGWLGLPTSINTMDLRRNAKR